MLPDNLKISDSELAKLMERFGEAETMDWIEALSLWKASKGKKTKSDYFTILNWERMERKRHAPVMAPVSKPAPDPEYLECQINGIHTMFQRDFEYGLRKDVPSREDIRAMLQETGM